METVSAEISREEELLETEILPILYGKSYKGFKEKDAVKNAWFLTLLNHFLKTILIIWLNSLVAGVPNFIPSVSFNFVYLILLRFKILITKIFYFRIVRF